MDLVVAVRGTGIRNSLLVGLLVLEGMLLVQLVVGAVLVAGGERPPSTLTFFAYLVGHPAVVPVGTLWSVAEKSRPSTLSTVACLAVAAMTGRLLQMWADAHWPSRLVRWPRAPPAGRASSSPSTRCSRSRLRRAPPSRSRRGSTRRACSTCSPRSRRPSTSSPAAAIARRTATWHWIALAACTFELVGVLTVGTLSLFDSEAFPDATVWSVYGRGYLFVPLVLPVAGLAYLRRHQVRRPG